MNSQPHPTETQPDQPKKPTTLRKKILSPPFYFIFLLHLSTNVFFHQKRILHCSITKANIPNAMNERME